MQASLPALKLLCDGQEFDLTNQQRTDLRRYFERFAAIVDLCSSSEQVSELPAHQAESYLRQLQHQHPAIIPFAIRRAWLDGAVIDQVAAHIGHHEGVLGINVDFNVSHPPDLDGSWKRITFVIRRLAVCIDVGRPGIQIPPSFTKLSALTRSPAPQSVTYDDYLALRNQDSTTLYHRTFIRFPQEVARWEHHVRSGKRIDEFW